MICDLEKKGYEVKIITKDKDDTIKNFKKELLKSMLTDNRGEKMI